MVKCASKIQMAAYFSVLAYECVTLDHHGIARSLDRSIAPSLHCAIVPSHLASLHRSLHRSMASCIASLHRIAHRSIASRIAPSHHASLHRVAKSSTRQRWPFSAIIYDGVRWVSPTWRHCPTETGRPCRRACCLRRRDYHTTSTLVSFATQVTIHLPRSLSDS